MRAATSLTKLSKLTPLLASLPLFVAVSSAPAANNSVTESSGLLCGRVLDSTDTPSSGALVFVLPADGNKPLAVSVSDSQGKFQFSDLPPGRYVLLAIHGHHSPGRSAPVVVGQLGSPFPLLVTLGAEPLDA